MYIISSVKNSILRNPTTYLMLLKVRVAPEGNEVRKHNINIGRSKNQTKNKPKHLFFFFFFLFLALIMSLDKLLSTQICDNKANIATYKEKRSSSPACTQYLYIHRRNFAVLMQKPHPLKFHVSL